MKKYLALLFVASIVLTSVVIAGCTKNVTNTTNNTTSTAKASPSVVTKTPQITVTPKPTATPTPTPSPTTKTQLHYGPFVASKESKDRVYHYPWCSHAKNIKPANLITFNTAEDAKAAGFRPCLDCNPP